MCIIRQTLLFSWTCQTKLAGDHGLPQSQGAALTERAARADLLFQLALLISDHFCKLGLIHNGGLGHVAHTPPKSSTARPKCSGAIAPVLSAIA
jgi:hypothetical protein